MALPASFTSALFRHIEHLQGDAPWGDFLDAGTGVNSGLWSRQLDLKSWTAISASPSHLAQVQASLSGVARATDTLLVGDWADPQLLAGRTYDTVLADYLLGAVDGFAPYFQEALFRRLRQHARGRLYVVGLDPYVVAPAQTEAQAMVRAIGRLRDAILLLADEQPYREYPLEWTLDAVQAAGFEITAHKRLGNRYRERWVHGQLDMAVRRLTRIPDPDLARALGHEIERLRAQACAVCRREDGLRSGSDFVIAARVA